MDERGKPWPGLAPGKGQEKAECEGSGASLQLQGDNSCFANDGKFWFCFVGDFLIPKEKSLSKIGHGRFEGM